MHTVRLNLHNSVPTDGEVHSPNKLVAADGCEGSALVSSDIGHITGSDETLTPTDFPPLLLNGGLEHMIVSDFCEKSTTSVLEEAGCAVCRRLVPTLQLTKLKAVKNLLPVLHAPNVTRIERSNYSQRICKYKGPILDHSCGHVCDGCRQHIRKGKVPLHALANGLWLGAVPKELSCLKFVERLLVVET